MILFDVVERYYFIKIDLIKFKLNFWKLLWRARLHDADGRILKQFLFFAGHLVLCLSMIAH